MNQFTICFILSAVVAFVTATTFEDCGSTSGEVISVKVTDCPDGQAVCTLKRGTQAVIQIEFCSKDDSKSLKAVVHGILALIPIPFLIPNRDACKTGITCPVKNGQAYTYKNNLNIRNSYPPVPVTVMWQLKDESGEDMVCVEIPCKLE